MIERRPYLLVHIALALKSIFTRERNRKVFISVLKPSN
jgi:hypothetical protein